MKAARIHRFGGPNTVHVEEIDRPEPKSGEALIRVRAAGVNPVDWMAREHIYNPPEMERVPLTLGQDFAGEIEVLSTLGRNGFKVGDRVFGEAWGTFAEFAVVRTKDLLKIPDDLSFETAASIPMASLTAWQVIHDAIKLKRGQRIVVHGAGGAVGSFAVQFARLKGAYVIGTASRLSFKHLKDSGIDELIDYKKQDFEKIVSDVDAVIDPTGGQVQAKSWGILKKGGVLVNLIDELDKAAAKKAGVRAISFAMEYDLKDLRKISELIGGGQVTSYVSKVLPLKKAREALSLNQNGDSHGKIVLKVA